MNAPPESLKLDRAEALAILIEQLGAKFGKRFEKFENFMTFKYDERKVREDAAEKVKRWLDGEGEDSVGESLKRLSGQLASVSMWGQFTPGQFKAYLEATDDLDRWAGELRDIVASFADINSVPHRTSTDRNRFKKLLEQYFEQLAVLSSLDVNGTAPANSRPISSAFPAAAHIACIPDIKHDALELLAKHKLVEKPSVGWGPDAYLHWVDELYELGEALIAYFADVESLEMYEITAFVVFAKYLLEQSGEPLVRLIESRKKLILQGPPGTGKTYLAEERIATGLVAGLLDDDESDVSKRDSDKRVVSLAQFESLIKSSGDEDPANKPRVVKELVQFHASYDYEDFVRGYRASEGGADGVGFELVDGPFARMATLAAYYPDSQFLLIIDEINRADIARVLGECIYILDRSVEQNSDRDDAPSPQERLVRGGEHTARPRYVPNDRALKELGDGDPLAIHPYLCFPSNFYILGTMNTADRSLAMLDMALRRRFAFEEMLPDWEVVLKEAKGKDFREKFLRDKCGSLFSQLNDELLAERRGLQVGHAYFMSDKNGGDAKRDVLEKIRYQLVPLLREYLEDGHFGSRHDEARSVIEQLLDLE